MNEPRSPIVRLFQWIWALVVFLYRASVVLVIVLFAIAFFASRYAGKPRVEANQPLALVPTGALADQVSDDRGRNLLRQFSEAKPPETLVRDLTDALTRAADDPHIPFAVLKLDDLDGAGLPQLEEVAVAVRKFRSAGKPVYAFGESFDQKQYYLAAQADEISLDPQGGVTLEGLSVYTNYFKDALDKLGVEVNVFRVGEFKSAVEPFERNDMSPEARTANEAWLGDLWKTYGKVVATARKLPETAVNDYVGSYANALKQHEGDTAKLALDAGLVTRIETLAQFRKRMVEKVGASTDKSTFRQIGFGDYLAATDDKSYKPGASKIGLVVVQGEIVDGEGDETNAGGDTIADLLDRARRDDEVSAVLLRVNSPGGSVVASEKIRRAVQALRDEEKPVVASMSSVAASGGYWVSMSADQIWAEPTTITGSIGIFGMIPTVVQPLNKLGVHTDGVGTTPLAGGFRIDRALTPEVKTIFQTEIEKGYRNFIEGVAKGRDIPVEQVNSIARGRVWSGLAAKDLGLVDDLGGLADAEAALAKLAKLDAGNWQLYEIQPERSYFGQLLGRLIGQSSSAGPLDAFARLLPQGLLGAQAVQMTQTLHMIEQPKGIYAYCFCTPAL